MVDIAQPISSLAFWVNILIKKRCLEYRRAFLAAYVDIQKAFDTVDMQTLWDLLSRRGIPDGILSLISAHYTNSESAIKSGIDVSSFFQIKSRMRQGCVLAPEFLTLVMTG